MIGSLFETTINLDELASSLGICDPSLPIPVLLPVVVDSLVAAPAEAGLDGEGVKRSSGFSD